VADDGGDDCVETAPATLTDVPGKDSHVYTLLHPWLEAHP
jgi:hypothetical protein